MADARIDIKGLFSSAARGVPAYAYGPGLLSVAHGPNEYVDLRKIIDCAAIYALTALEMLQP